MTFTQFYSLIITDFSVFVTRFVTISGFQHPICIKKQEVSPLPFRFSFFQKKICDFAKKHLHFFVKYAKIEM